MSGVRQGFETFSLGLCSVFSVLCSLFFSFLESKGGGGWCALASLTYVPLA